MRIAFLSDGANVHTERWLAYFEGEGDEVALVTLEAPRDFGGATVFRLGPARGPRSLAYTAALPAARRAVAAFGPDLLNAHFLPNYGWLAMLIGRRPWVLSTWGSDVLVNPHRGAYQRWRARRVLAAADLVTSDAAMLTDAIRAIGPTRRDVLTVPMGIDRALVEQPLPGAGRPPVLLHSRNLEEVYDVATVLRALVGFFQVFPGWRARLAGDGSLRGELERLSDGLGLGDKVEFLGRLPREQLLGELSRASIYLSASLSDSTSVSLLEAMALGAYPVLSDIPANREWIESSPAVRYFTPGQPDSLTRALLEALAMPDGERAAAVASNRALVAERAVWEDNMAVVRAAYLALAAEGRAR